MGETLVDGQHPNTASPTCGLFDLRDLVRFVCGAGVSHMLISHTEQHPPGFTVFCSVVLSELSLALRVLRMPRMCGRRCSYTTSLTSAPVSYDYCQPF